MTLLRFMKDHPFITVCQNGGAEQIYELELVTAVLYFLVRTFRALSLSLSYLTESIIKLLCFYEFVRETRNLLV